MPVNGLLIRDLLLMYPFYGPDFKVECPTGPGKHMNLFEVAQEIVRRLSSIVTLAGGAPFTAAPGNSRKILIGAITSSFTSTSMATTERAQELASNGMDRFNRTGDRPVRPACSGSRTEVSESSDGRNDQTTGGGRLGAQVSRWQFRWCKFKGSWDKPFPLIT